MPDCPACSQSGTGMKKKQPCWNGLVPVKADANEHFLVLSRTNMMDAGMPMPA
jgi:hypothetical protein